MEEDAYNQRLPIAMLHAHTHSVAADIRNQRLAIAMLHGHNYNVPANIILIFSYLERGMSQLESACANYTMYIIKLFFIYVAIQAAVLTAVITAPQQTGACEIWRWCPLILSGIASSAMTAFLVEYLVQLFRLLKNGEQLQEQRDHLIERFLRNSRIHLFSTYGRRTVFQEAKNWWWTAHRVVFVVMFIAFSVFLMLSCTRLLC